MSQEIYFLAVRKVGARYEPTLFLMNFEFLIAFSPSLVSPSNVAQHRNDYKVIVVTIVYTI